MRIIGGEAGGRRIQAPEGRQTRPTAERVREAVFSMLGGDMSGDRVLDVFAGSGAMALEAVSRGADCACMCDSSKQAAAVIKRNVETLGYQSKAKLFPCDWRAALNEMIPPSSMSLKRVNCSQTARGSCWNTRLRLSSKGSRMGLNSQSRISTAIPQLLC